MALTQNEIRLVKDTWGYIIVNKIKAGELFYTKLFEIAPAVRPLFKENISEQAEKLVDMVTIIVAKLNKLEDVLAEVDFLAKKHVKYGAAPSHYAPVGQALLSTLEAGLGDKWNKDVKDAWTKVYGILSDAMIQAQAKHSK